MTKAICPRRVGMKGVLESNTDSVRVCGEAVWVRNTIKIQRRSSSGGKYPNYKQKFKKMNNQCQKQERNGIYHLSKQNFVGFP
jgi:hypothetical protein